MDCERFRERIGQDPAKRDEEFERHAADCAACRAYAARLADSERLIQKALRFDVEALRSGAARPPRAGVLRRQWLPALTGLAAGIVGALVVWTVVLQRPALTPELLATAVVEHWYHEPRSWIETAEPVAGEVLNAVLDGKASIDLGRVGTVSYARSCFVGGEWIPHLVVQGAEGPIMVLLMPDRSVTEPIPLALPDEGLGGRIVPVSGGSIAVLGEPGDEVEEIEAALAGAVDWTI